jgi:hypothetical protein
MTDRSERLHDDESTGRRNPDRLRTPRDRRPSAAPGTRADERQTSGSDWQPADARYPRDNRGISEVIGFVLSFSIIILSVALVFTYGFSAVQDMREAEQLNSAERALEAVAGTLENLQRGDPARASEIRVAGGQLDIRNRSRVVIHVNDSTTSNTLYRYDRPVGEILYSYQETNISYQTGAVFRSGADGTGGLMVRSPTLVCRDDRAVVSVLRIRNIEASSGVDSVGAEGSITVSARTNETSLLYPVAERQSVRNATDVSVRVDSPQSQLWTDWFDSSSNGWDTSPFSIPGKAKCDADRVIVRETFVEIRFLV